MPLNNYSTHLTCRYTATVDDTHFLVRPSGLGFLAASRSNVNAAEQALAPGCSRCSDRLTAWLPVCVGVGEPAGRSTRHHTGGVQRRAPTGWRRQQRRGTDHTGDSGHFQGVVWALTPVVLGPPLGH